MTQREQELAKLLNEIIDAYNNGFGLHQAVQNAVTYTNSPSAEPREDEPRATLEGRANGNSPQS